MSFNPRFAAAVPTRAPEVLDNQPGSLHFDMTTRAEAFEAPNYSLLATQPAPAGQQIEMRGDDLRFVYASVKAAATKFVDARLAGAGIALDHPVATDARALAHDELRRAFEQARHAVTIEGHPAPPLEEFRATFEETSGFEPLDTELSGQVHDLWQQIAKESGELMRLRRQVPAEAAQNFAAYAAAVPFGGAADERQKNEEPQLAIAQDGGDEANAAAETHKSPAGRGEAPPTHAGLTALAPADLVELLDELDDALARVPGLEAELAATLRQLRLLEQAI